MKFKQESLDTKSMWDAEVLIWVGTDNPIFEALQRQRPNLGKYIHFKGLLFIPFWPSYISSHKS